MYTINTRVSYTVGQILVCIDELKCICRVPLFWAILSQHQLPLISALLGPQYAMLCFGTESPKFHCCTTSNALTHFNTLQYINTRVWYTSMIDVYVHDTRVWLVCFFFDVYDTRQCSLTYTTPCTNSYSTSRESVVEVYHPLSSPTFYSSLQSM